LNIPFGVRIPVDDLELMEQIIYLCLGLRGGDLFDVVEALMGHEGYLTEVYRRYSEEDLAAFYKKGEHALAVFSNGAEVSKLKSDIEEKSKILNEGMATLALKNAELENRLTALIASNQGEKKTWDLKLKEIKENQKRMGELIRKAVELEMDRRKA
jgi:hypothetical protein